MDSQIEEMVKTCTVCQESRPSPAVAPLHPCEWPSKPWNRLHLDFAGPFHIPNGFMFILCNRLPLPKPLRNSVPSFLLMGLPLKVVTDNGPSFTSKEFKTFLSQNGIAHITTTPYHPSSNGLAERAVQTFKQGLKWTPGNTIQERLSKFLFTYRITPHAATTGIPPATLLMGRRLTSRLDRIFPDLNQRVQNKQLKQAQHHKPLRTFNVGDTYSGC